MISESLTEEWHNKFGVIKNGFGNFEYILPRKFNMNITVIHTHEYVYLRQGEGSNRYNDDLVAIWNKDVSRRDMYVHEWQNLYFALCGEELKIKNHETKSKEETN